MTCCECSLGIQLDGFDVDKSQLIGGLRFVYGI